MNAVVKGQEPGEFLYIEAPQYAGTFPEFMAGVRAALTRMRDAGVGSIVAEFPNRITLTDVADLVPGAFSTSLGGYFREHGINYFQITKISNPEGAQVVDGNDNLYEEE